MNRNRIHSSFIIPNSSFPFTVARPCENFTRFPILRFSKFPGRKTTPRRFCYEKDRLPYFLSIGKGEGNMIKAARSKMDGVGAAGATCLDHRN
jgi:hypothetical protein